LGRLDSVSILLPDTSMFLYMFVRKEAVLSSQIEGTQSSLSDLLLYEMDQEPGVPVEDVEEVSNYVAALNHGLMRLAEGFPISLRLLKEMHSVLLSKGRGSHLTPGEFRKSQNWIGGSRPSNAVFVPPPANQLLECMGHLEQFLHDQPSPTSTLLKAALTHVQFETIHPFLDGNGRIGRLLITLLLCWKQVLKEPMLYLSLYFKQHRQQYYTLLNDVRLTGNWEAWLEFFADAVIATSKQSMQTAQRLVKLSREDREAILSLGRISNSVLRVHQGLLDRPIASAKWLVKNTHLSPATVNKCLLELQSLGITKELTEQKRNKLFSYAKYIEILNEGTEL
ncbi:MAG: Fic family protein, partial [Candidatus Obscuribacterales bacterium]|nr:Fic family protein [Candidatus Obscuribacterales bacterium]